MDRTFTRKVVKNSPKNNKVILDKIAHDNDFAKRVVPIVNSQGEFIEGWEYWELKPKEKR